MNPDDNNDFKLPAVDQPTQSQTTGFPAMAYNDQNQYATSAPQTSPLDYAPTQQTVQPVVAPHDYNLSAEDVDLIEKAWVEKAKSIVRATHGDPYRQNKELSKIKADYIRKRFNRDMKVAE